MIPFVRNVLKNLLTGPATRNYPAAPSPTVEGGRFRLDMNIGDCVFCAPEGVPQGPSKSGATNRRGRSTPTAASSAADARRSARRSACR